MNDLVSIITPCYNASKFILQTIDSVLAQTHQNWEMIIVDDCSTDNSVILIQDYIKKDNRIKLIKLIKNNGIAVARNTAIKKATGRYIAFLDADDLWLPQKLERQINFMNTNNLSFTYSSYSVVDENNNDVGKFITKEYITYKEMLKTSSIGCLTAIYDTKELGKIYFENTKNEDYILWLKILKKIGATKGLTDTLAIYRIVNNSVSRNKLKTALWQWRIYRNTEKLNIVKSAYFFIQYAYFGFFKYKKRPLQRKGHQM